MSMAIDARTWLDDLAAAARAQQFSAIAQRLRAPLPALARERERALDTAMQLAQYGQSMPAFIVLSQLRRELPNDAQVCARHDIERAYGMAGLHEQQGRTGAALAAADALLRAVPWHRATRMLRASILAERGETSAVVEEYQRILEQVPGDAIAGSAMLIAMQHDPAIAAQTIAAAHRHWAERHMPIIAPRWSAQLPHADPDRALRIGWISPRFFSGLVADFFLPALTRFDRNEATHTLYDTGGVEDAVAAQLRHAADAWRAVSHLDDAALCEVIRADGIDVLVELSGHSPGNRLRALARRPAPVQVAWLDYFHSTGTAAVDVLLGDTMLNPPRFARHCSERVLTLPSGRLCATAPSAAPPILPRTAKPLRFASFNRINKLNDAVLAAWSEVLAGVPGSVLRLKARVFDSADERAYFLARCARHGIAGDRLELLGYGSHAQTLAAYADVDIALDPFPFSGCATSLDALWMGVPVVSMPGETMVSRQSASLLVALGLEETLAQDTAGYVRVAIDLANDATRRHALRMGLRERMRERLCDADRHARELSGALREAWRLWCCGDFDSGRAERPSADAHDIPAAG